MPDIVFILYVRRYTLQKDLETNISYKVFSTIPNQLAFACLLMTAYYYGSSKLL